MQTKGNILAKIKQQSKKFVTFTVLTLLSAIFGLGLIFSNETVFAQTNPSEASLCTPVRGESSFTNYAFSSNPAQISDISKDANIKLVLDYRTSDQSLKDKCKNYKFNVYVYGNDTKSSGYDIPYIKSEGIDYKEILESGVFKGFRVETSFASSAIFLNYPETKNLNSLYVSYYSVNRAANVTGDKRFSFPVAIQGSTNAKYTIEKDFVGKIQISGVNQAYRVVDGSNDGIDLKFTTKFSQSPHPVAGDKVTNVVKRNYTFKGIYGALNYKIDNNKLVCESELWGNNCSIKNSDPTGLEQQYMRLNLSDLGFSDSERNSATKEKPAQKSYMIFPVLDMDEPTLSFGNNDYALAGSPIYFDVQLYPKGTDLKQTCIDEYLKKNPSGSKEDADKACVDPKKIGEEQKGGSADTGATNTGGTTVGFLVSLIADIIASIIAFVRIIIFYLVAFIIIPILSSLLAIQTYTDEFAQVILPGWNIIRNIGNIFFVVILIVIGLTTLFRIEGYQYKDLLVKLVIAAVLVNFSLVIGQAVLAIAETVQFQFLPADSLAIEALAKQLIIQPTQQGVEITFQKFGTGEAFAKLINPFFTLALAIGSAIVLGAIAVFLIIRMVALWILLMLSPIPYIADILPATRSYKKQWWSYFLRYAFFTPIMAFFLNLAAYISQNQGELIQKIVKNSASGKQIFQSSGGTEWTAFFFTASTNILLLVFLIAAIKVANAFGIEGANTFTNIANKGIKLPFKLGAGAAAGAGGLAASYAQQKKQEITSDLAERGRLGRLAFTLTNPVTSTKAGISRLKERQQAVESRAKATAYDTVQKLPGGSLLGDKSRQVQSNTTKDVKQYSERNPYVNPEITKNDLKETFTSGSKDYNARLRVEAKLTQLAEDKELGATLTNAKKDLGLDNNYDSSTAGFAAFMNDLVKKGYVTKDRAAYLAEDLGKIAKKNKENYYDGATTVDQNTGELKLIDAEVRDVGGKKQAVINGEEIYNTTNQTIIEKQEKAVEDLGPGADSAKKAEVIDKIKKEEVDKLSDTDRASYKNYESYVKSVDAQKTAAQKTSPDSIAKDANAGQFVATDASSGKKKLNDVGADFVAKANDRHYAQSDNVGYGLKQGFISALTDNKDESVKLVAKALQDRALKEDGVKIPDQKATELAQKKIAEFGDKFLQYNLDSKTPLFKQQKAVIDNVLIKEAEFKDALYTGVSKGSDRSDVKSYINEMVSNPSSYKYDLPSQLSNKFIDKNAESKVQERVKKYMGDMYADRFKPKDLGLPSLDQSEVDSIREAIRKGFSETVDSNKGRSISDDAVRDMLKNTIKAKVQASSSTAEVKLKSAEIAEKLIADIKPISVNNPSTQPPPVNPPPAGQNVP